MPLTASERVTLIKEIANRIEDENWPVIDMTLSEFGLPTENTWNGGANAYVMKMVQGASESVLIELAKHLGFELKSRPGLPEPAVPTQNRLLRVFISHLATEKIYASSLQKALLGCAIDSFVAHTDIEPAAEWQNVIESELRTCDALVALLHPDFHKSAWTDQEMGFVMGRDTPVFTVRLGQTPYGFVGRFQAFQGIDKRPELIANELFHAYRKHSKTKSQMRESLLRKFEKSRSYASATENVGFLEEMDRWEDEYYSRILSALKNNDQISNAFGVKDRVLALAKKWDPLPF
jgi:hypothetical protein